MGARRLSDRFLGWVRGWFARGSAQPVRGRGPLDHVIILDGTLSSLVPGRETNAGLTFKLLREAGLASIYYEAGIQWHGWRSARDIISGRGINRQIRRAYGYLSSRYLPGDRIYLMGYSRGAFAVRSLAGIIDRIGLLRAEEATERNVRQIYRLYERDPTGATAQAFAQAFCHPDTRIEMVGVWDTVKALGLRLPVLWQLTEAHHAFHNHDLGRHVNRGFHALARDETREAFAPVLWTTPSDHGGQLEQVWFPGTHGDVGGQLGGVEAARPLANIPLVWMLSKLEGCGVILPDRWRDRFPTDPAAPSCGTWHGLGVFFLLRRPRRMGQDPSERQYIEKESAGDLVSAAE